MATADPLACLFRFKQWWRETKGGTDRLTDNDWTQYVHLSIVRPCRKYQKLSDLCDTLRTEGKTEATTTYHCIEFNWLRFYLCSFQQSYYNFPPPPPCHWCLFRGEKEFMNVELLLRWIDLSVSDKQKSRFQIWQFGWSVYHVGGRKINWILWFRWNSFEIIKTD